MGNSRIGGLTRTVAHHCVHTRTVSEPDRFERIGERPDLVRFDQDTVRRIVADTVGDPAGVRDEQVIAADQAPVTDLLGKGGKSL